MGFSSCSITMKARGEFKEYKIIGRMMPTDKNRTPPLYQMKIFAPDKVTARSRFWYHVSQLKKMKKSQGEVLLVNRSTRRNHWLSRTSPSGCVTIPGVELTTCTENIVT